MSSFYQGLACLSSENYYTNCTLRGFPEYVVEASKVAQMQHAASSARTHTLRLVVTNTGHDFSGRSLGSGALIIWTNKLKRLEFYKEYSSPTHTRSAMKVGDGDLIYELYEAADAHGVVVVGGEGKTVGLGGGYIAGGGHSLVSPLYGLADGHVLGIDVVTPDGKSIPTSEKKTRPVLGSPGGGRGTFGVVTS